MCLSVPCGNDTWLHLTFIYDVRRPFLLPRVKALLFKESILLSVEGDVGLGAESLPDRRLAC